MTCTDVENELVGYHFGTVSLSAREALEAHLPGCSSCLRSFLMLKRSFETDETDLPVPSAASRARLRRAVAAQVGEGQAPAPWQWWQRPFAFASAVAVVFVAMVLTFRIATSEVSAPFSLATRQLPVGTLVAMRANTPVRSP